MKIFQKKLSDLTIGETLSGSIIIGVVTTAILWLSFVIPSLVESRRVKKEEEK